MHEPPAFPLPEVAGRGQWTRISSQRCLVTNTFYGRYLPQLRNSVNLACNFYTYTVSVRTTYKPPAYLLNSDGLQQPFSELPLIYINKDEKQVKSSLHSDHKSASSPPCTQITSQRQYYFNMTSATRTELRWLRDTRRYFNRFVMSNSYRSKLFSSSTRSSQQRFHEIAHACSQSILCLRRHIGHAGLLAQDNLVFSSFILPLDTSVFTSKLRGKVVNLPRQIIFA